MNRKRWIALGCFIGLFIVYLFVNLFQGGPLQDEQLSIQQDWREEVYMQGSGLERLALIEIDGIITSQPAGLFAGADYQHEIIMDQIEHAFADDQVAGIVMRVNSPGGGAVESDEIYHKIVSMKEQHDKPFVVYMGSTAASGGYYISAPADLIYAHPSTITGSIGSILSAINFSELAEEWGVREEAFTSGPYKNILSSFEEVTDEERAILQSMVDDSYEIFVDVVAEGRGMDRDTVYELADGRIYTGNQAKEVGLVDEVGLLEDALAEAATIAEVEDPTVIQYKHSSWPAFDRLFFSLGRGVPSVFDQLQALPSNQQNYYAPSLMYLWSW